MYDEPLGRAIGFSEDDLKSNQSEMLTDVQRQVLYEMLNKRLPIWFAIVGVPVIGLYVLVSPGLQPVIAVPGGIVLAVSAIYIVMRRYRDHRMQITNGTPRVVQGVVRKQDDGKQIRVSGKNLSFEIINTRRHEWEAFDDGKIYRVYYFHSPEKILSAEKPD